MASQNQNTPDESTVEKLNSHLTKAGTTVANNKKIIFWAVVAVAVAAAFTLSYLFIYRNPHLQKSYEAYNKVEINATNDSVAAAQYKEVADKFKGDAAGNLAALSAGEALYNEGKYAEAAEYLKRFDCDDEVLNANALILTGDCFVNLKKYDEALDFYAKAVKECDGNPQIAPRALLKEANIYDEQKKYDKALECYKTIKNDFPEFQLGNGLGIDAYIAREEARIAK